MSKLIYYLIALSYFCGLQTHIDLLCKTGPLEHREELPPCIYSNDLHSRSSQGDIYLQTIHKNCTETFISCLNKLDILIPNINQ